LNIRRIDKHSRYAAAFGVLDGKQEAIMARTCENVETLIARKPGLTAPEIARSLFGAEAIQQQVNPSLLGLAGEGRLERRGFGGSVDPFRYFPRKKKNA
jgi:hypothetical protein